MDFKSKGLPFIEPHTKTKKILFDFDAWNKAIKFYDEGKYNHSFEEILKYANKEVDKYKTDENIYKIPHGSVFLNIDFSGDEIKIYSDFLNVSNANRIPLYREITEINFSGLNLSQIKLDNDNLRFEYNCPASLYEPYKIFDVLVEICYFSDKYDEEFCEKFEAKNIVEGEIQQISEQDKEKIYASFKKIIENNLSIIEDLESKRRNYLAWDTISITYKMIDFVCNPNGSLRLKISESVGDLYSREDSIETIIFRGKEILREFNAMTKEEFNKNIYMTNEFIPYKKMSNSESISQYLSPGYEDAKKMLQSNYYEGAYLMFMHILYNALYYHVMPNGIERTIIRQIKRGSNIKINEHSVEKLSFEILDIVNHTNIMSDRKGFLGFILVAFGFIIGLFFN